MNGLIAWSVLSSTLVYFRIPKDDGSGDYDDATTSENLLGELIVAFLLTSPLVIVMCYFSII